VPGRSFDPRAWNNFDIPGDCITMNYMRSSSRKPDYGSAARSILAIAVLACFLTVATGGVQYLHHHADGPESSGSTTCQICYLIAVAAVVLSTAFVFLFSITQAAHPRNPAAMVPVPTRAPISSVAPRAPPRG